MKDSAIAHALSLDLLRFIRDGRPTEAELLDWLGAARRDRYYLLRRHGLLAEGEDGLVRLSPDFLSADGHRFRWGNSLYHRRSGSCRWTASCGA